MWKRGWRSLSCAAQHLSILSFRYGPFGRAANFLWPSDKRIALKLSVRILRRIAGGSTRRRSNMFSTLSSKQSLRGKESPLEIIFSAPKSQAYWLTRASVFNSTRSSARKVPGFFSKEKMQNSMKKLKLEKIGNSNIQSRKKIGDFWRKNWD